MTAKNRADQVPIGLNQDNQRGCQDFSHCLIIRFQCCSMAACIFSGLLDRISRLTITTRSLAGKRCCALRKLSRNCRFRRFRITALGTCLRAMANPIRGYSPGFFPTRMVIQESEHRVLFLNTCWNSKDRVSLSCLGKDSLIPAPTLRGETCSTFRASRLDHTTTATRLHTRAETMRSGTF